VQQLGRAGSSAITSGAAPGASPQKGSCGVSLLIGASEAPVVSRRLSSVMAGLDVHSGEKARRSCPQNEHLGRPSTRGIAKASVAPRVGAFAGPAAISPWAEATFSTFS